MENNEDIVQEGVIFIATEGEYEDFSLNGLYRALVTFDPNQLKLVYMDVVGKSDSYVDYKGLLGWLVSEGKIQKLPVLEMNIDAYWRENRKITVAGIDNDEDL